jgi:hypothetical protein
MDVFPEKRDVHWLICELVDRTKMSARKCAVCVGCTWNLYLLFDRLLKPAPRDQTSRYPLRFTYSAEGPLPRLLYENTGSRGGDSNPSGRAAQPIIKNILI